MTLNSFSHGLAALTTEPLAVGMLGLVSKRSGTGGDTSTNVQEMLGRFGYQLTPDHIGYLTGGVLVGVALGALPRFFMKYRSIQKAKMPKVSGQRRNMKKQAEANANAAGKTYSRKARKQGALVERMQALK